MPGESSPLRPPLKMKQSNIHAFFAAKGDTDRDRDDGQQKKRKEREQEEAEVTLPKKVKVTDENLEEEQEEEEDVVVIESDEEEEESHDKVDSDRVPEAEEKSEEGEDKKDEVEDEEFEVERVLDYSWCRATNRGLYKVKWLGWDREEDHTWEPADHLEGAAEKLKEFYYTRLEEREAAKPGKKRFLEVPPDPRTHFERRSQVADQIFPPPCLSTLEELFAEHRRRPVKAWPEHILNGCLDRLGKSKKQNELKKTKVRQQLMLKYVKEARKSQQERLREWEREINSAEHPQPRVSVENECDLEGPPRHMKYITRYRPSPGIVIPEDPLIGCECPGGACDAGSASGCCPGASDATFPYTKFGRLRLEVGMPVFECNKRCACSEGGQEGCYNRVVQKGRKVKLCIYRTDNGCGWGVKTLEKIKRGQFVVEYVGEVITSEEAEERGKVYDAEGRTYLFDLDYNLGPDNPYTVDAAEFGNVSHFINHSCDPNLSIFNVWIDCLDPNLPRLCMFARRDIAKGEQITFDYCRQTLNSFDIRDYVADSPPTDKEGSVDVEQLSREKGAPQEEKKASRTECRCGAHNCRKWLFD